jgi:uncharacterized protein YgbK (DUF1537 family)
MALMLARGGRRTILAVGVPAGDASIDADAVVVALKSRTAPVDEAVAQSLAALEWLRRAGASRFFFKYCSTFDSTDAGNIGPVADAMMDALGGRIAIACPAFPANGRTIFQGHLFVGDRLLSESGMRNHPLTPMTDPDLVRVLGRQTKHRVGLVPQRVVAAGQAAITQALGTLAKDGARYAIVDAVSDSDLHMIGAAVARDVLITGGSGVAMGLPQAYRDEGMLPSRSDAQVLPSAKGLAACLAGSCSQATLQQIEEAKSLWPSLRLDPLALAAGAGATREAIAWSLKHVGVSPILVYASAAPDEVKAVQAALGRERAGALVEHALAEIAEALVAEGVGKLVVAGGETSGAVVGRLGATRLRIGPEIAPGVPWLSCEDGPRIHVALKSGNFGGRDFFARAIAMLG